MEPACAVASRLDAHQDRLRPAGRDAAHGIGPVEQPGRVVDDLALEAGKAGKDVGQETVGREEPDVRLLGHLEDVVAGRVVGADRHPTKPVGVAGCGLVHPPAKRLAVGALVGQHHAGSRRRGGERTHRHPPSRAVRAGPVDVAQIVDNLRHGGIHGPVRDARDRWPAPGAAGRRAGADRAGRRRDAGRDRPDDADRLPARLRRRQPSQRPRPAGRRGARLGRPGAAARGGPRWPPHPGRDHLADRDRAGPPPPWLWLAVPGQRDRGDGRCGLRDVGALDAGGDVPVLRARGLSPGRERRPGVSAAIRGHAVLSRRADDRRGRARSGRRRQPGRDPGWHDRDGDGEGSVAVHTRRGPCSPCRRSGRWSRAAATASSDISSSARRSTSRA